MCWSCITNNALKIKITHAYMFSGPTYYIKYFHLPCMHVRCFALMNLITKVSMHCFINMQTWFFLLWMFPSRIVNIKKWEILRKKKLFILPTLLLIWRSYNLFWFRFRSGSYCRWALAGHRPGLYNYQRALRFRWQHRGCFGWMWHPYRETHCNRSPWSVLIRPQARLSLLQMVCLSSRLHSRL